MTKRRSDEFYVGYEAKAPPAIARRVRAIVVTLAVAVPGLFALVGAAQDRLPSGVFEFGVYREFEGVLYEKPLPVLRVTSKAEPPAAASLLLAGFGKGGIPKIARGHHGQLVRFKGSLVYRRNTTMVEMNDPASFEVLGEPGPGQGRGRFESLGPATLTGELVDTKCFLGVMKPATGKVHRACAVRCLEGGVPPGLLVRNRTGPPTVFLLAGPEQGALDIDLQLAAREIEAQGILELHDDLAVLRVEHARPLDRHGRAYAEP